MKYYHIYFDENEEEIQIYYLNENEKDFHIYFDNKKGEMRKNYIKITNSKKLEYS